MKRVFIPIICLLMTSPLLGQTSQPTSAPSKTQGNPRPTWPRSTLSRFERDTVKIVDELGLDTDQHTAMKAMLEVMRTEAGKQLTARAEIMRNQAEALKKARQEIQIVRRAGDRKRVVQLKETIDGIRKAQAAVESYETYKIFFERIEVILTDEQKAQLPELKNKYPAKPVVKPVVKPPSPLNRTRVSALVRTLELSDDQKVAIELVEEAFTLRMTAAPIFDPDEYAEFKQDFFNAMAALLNDEQRTKFEDKVDAAIFESAPSDHVKPMASRPKFMFSTVKKLDLTAPQKKQVARVERDFAERLANRKPRDAIAKRAPKSPAQRQDDLQGLQQQGKRKLSC